MSQPAALLHSLQSIVPVLALSTLYGPRVAGLFAFVHRGVWAPLALIAQAVGDVFIGNASEHSRQDPQRLQELFSKITVTLMKVMGVPVLLLAVFAPQLFGWILGSEWRAAGVYMRLLGPTFVVMLVVGPVAYTISLLERQGWLLAIEGVGAVLVLGSFGLAARMSWSPEQAVFAYAMSMTFIYAAVYVAARRAIRQTVSR